MIKISKTKKTFFVILNILLFWVLIVFAVIHTFEIPQWKYKLSDNSVYVYLRQEVRYKDVLLENKYIKNDDFDLSQFHNKVIESAREASLLVDNSFNLNKIGHHYFVSYDRESNVWIVIQYNRNNSANPMCYIVNKSSGKIESVWKQKETV